MIFIDRPHVPEFFLKADVRRKEQERIRVWFNQKHEEYRFEYSAKDIPGLMESLREMFANKCAYCESKLDKNLNNKLSFFRPPQEAIQEDDTVSLKHYWWLSWEWPNLYLACPECIQMKGRKFPTKSLRAEPETKWPELQAEEPLLLDPCLDNPSQHLIFEESGMIVSKEGSERGNVTIEVLELNRESLRFYREENAKRTKELLRNCLQSSQTNKGKVDLSIASQISVLEARCEANQPFAGMTRQLLQRWLQEAKSLSGTIYEFPLMPLNAPEWQALIMKLVDYQLNASIEDVNKAAHDVASQTYPVPVTRKLFPVERSSTISALHTPEPTLDIKEYEQILRIISNMVMVMERSPRAFIKIGEEDLRQHFLVQLNGQYEGQATGETFNFEGKTDILIRADGRNIFIAECKFWKGAEAFRNTIDQLLGYTSWRDTKTAIILFNRTKNLSAVLSQIPTAVASHPNFKKQVDYLGETNFRFILRQRDDLNREILLTVLVFDIPT
jgi:uncharacterized protein (TIGR02646 family)